MTIRRRTATMAALALLAGTPVVHAAPAGTPVRDAGLTKHPFVYCGEYQYDHEQQTIHIVRGGRDVWTHDLRFHVIRGGKQDIQELGDCTLLSNGNLIFTSRFGAAEIAPNKTIVWQYLAPDGTEIHSLQPLGLNRVLLAQNGDPAVALTIDKATNTVVKRFVVPVGDTTKAHGQMRRVRMTAAGTYLVAHMDRNKVVEYGEDGAERWSVAAESPWSAVRLRSGNTLISSNKGFVREVNPAGATVWEYTTADAAKAGIDLHNVQEVTRLANGNTLVTNWVANALKPPQWPGSVQAFEVTPAKAVVWRLSSWARPNLGPATSIQLLDEPGRPEDGALQR